jgi:hypothetical protein
MQRLSLTEHGNSNSQVHICLNAFDKIISNKTWCPQIHEVLDLEFLLPDLEVDDPPF